MRRTLFLFALIALVAGCNSSSFVGRHYDDFTAYYNKFYNARQTYATATESAQQLVQPIDRMQFLALFHEAGAASYGGNLQDVVTKSADVLREHPGSKWVDDALLLIGKAYYYQGNFFGAEQKFREVMATAGPLDGEARFWLARTLITSGAYPQAYEHLMLSLDEEDLSARWRPMLQLALGELYVKQGEWIEAADVLALGMEDVRDRALKARAQFLLGQIYETMGLYLESVAAFNRVETFRPVYDLTYAAQVSAIRVAGLHGDGEWALQALRRMERDDKNYDNQAELAYLRGHVLQAMGRSNEALTVYRDLLYNSQTNATGVRGRVHYALGGLFRDQYSDFVLASAHYDTAATVLGPALQSSAAQASASGMASAPQYSQEAITDVLELAERFSSFSEVRTEVARMDSLLYLGTLEEAEFDDFVLDLRRQLAAEQTEQRRELERRQVEEGFREGASSLPGNRSPGQQAASTAGSAGFLFHQEPARVQEGRLLFIDRWGDRPLVPNWRRMSAIGSVTEQAGAGGPDSLLQASQAFADADGAFLPEIDLSAVPRTPETQAAMQDRRAAARYELANVLFLSLNLPDSAAVWYRTIIEEDAGHPVASRAYYALAEVHRTLGDTLSAHRLYQQILDQYPEADFVDQIRERLGLIPAQRVPTDSLALAERAYGVAYTVWQSGRYPQSIRGMLNVAAQYTSTNVAPRALLAAASAFTEWAHQDSLDFFAEIPVDVPDSLLWSGVLARSEEPGPLAAETDSLAVVLSDSVDAAPGDSVAVVPADSVAVPTNVRPASLRLESLYAAIVENYPSSTYAAQARAHLEAIAERQALLFKPDSTAASGPPAIEEIPLDAGALAAPDSVAAPGDGQNSPPAGAAPGGAGTAPPPDAPVERADSTASGVRPASDSPPVPADTSGSGQPTVPARPVP